MMKKHLSHCDGCQKMFIDVTCVTVGVEDNRPVFRNYCEHCEMMFYKEKMYGCEDSTRQSY